MSNTSHEHNHRVTLKEDLNDPAKSESNHVGRIAYELFINIAETPRSLAIGAERVPIMCPECGKPDCLNVKKYGVPERTPFRLVVSKKCNRCFVKRDGRGELVCGKCGLIVNQDISMKINDTLEKLIQYKKAAQERTLVDGRRVVWIGSLCHPIVKGCSPRYMKRSEQQLRSDFKDFRIVTLLKNAGGSALQADIPEIYKNMFYDDNNPAIITTKEVEASIKRLRDAEKVGVIGISTSKGKRNIIKLINQPVTKLIGVSIVNLNFREFGVVKSVPELGLVPNDSEPVSFTSITEEEKSDLIFGVSSIF